MVMIAALKNSGSGVFACILRSGVNMKLNCSEFAKMYKKGDSSDKVLLDVRDPDECAAGSLNGSINIILKLKAKLQIFESV